MKQIFSSLFIQGINENKFFHFLRYSYITNLVFKMKRGIWVSHVGNQQASFFGNHKKS